MIPPALKKMSNEQMPSPAGEKVWAAVKGQCQDKKGGIHALKKISISRCEHLYFS
jgi:hypothetical protein